MSSNAFSSGSAPNVSSAAVGTTAQQADTLTRNFILGIPKGGLLPNSPEAADLQAAEAFVSDIQQEILAYDIANARAIESYAVRCWSAVPFFGRHAKRALEAEATATAAAAAAAEETHKSADTAGVAAAVDGKVSSSGGHGLHLSPEEAAAALQVGGVYLHRQTSQTPRGFKVERTSAIDLKQLSQFTDGARDASGSKAASKSAVAVAASKAAPAPEVNTWLFRRQHPSWVPLMQRWWVPWLCCGSIVLIWTPDVWKLRTLYFCDHQYALFRQSIHKAYWWATMSPEDYAAHMADITAERPSRVPHSVTAAAAAAAAMDHLCVDPHDAAATKIEMYEVDSAPDTPVAVVAVNEGADASSPALEEEQASADEDGGSIGDALCEVEAEASMFLQASAAELAPLQLSALTRRVEIAPLNATTIFSGVPVVSAVDEVYVHAPPNAYATSMAGYSQSAAALEDDAAPVGLWTSPAETRIDLTAAAEEGASQELYDRPQQEQLQVDGTASRPREVPVTAAEVSDSQAWAIDFAPAKRMPTRKMTKKEKDAIKRLRVRRQTMGADSEGNTVVPVDASALTGSLSSSPLQVVQLDTLALDRDALIPVNLKTTRADLEARLVLRLPRLLCVNKQYPRACGIASLTSVYNYLYSWLGESAVGTNRPPHSQEEIMSILGFEPPFGEIAWGSFTGNATLIRWFHALNRHFGVRGRAYILYKVHGSGKTTHLYNNNTDALAAVKAALRDPHCALIYHCHNHYMVPIGYQDIPLAQADFLKPTVAESSCDTTIFIGEVSRGRHEAMYARKWSQIVKDIECKSPFFFNIRHPEQGVQRREPKKKLSKEGADEGADVTVRAVAATTATTTASVAVAATAQMRDADGLQQRQQKRQAQELQGGNSSEAHSSAETILVALPNAIPRSGATVLRGISDNDVDADFLDDAASNTSSDTIEVMVFAATPTPPLPPAAPSSFLQQPLPHTSLSPAVSTMAALKPGLAKSPEDVGDGLSIATVMQLQALAEKVVAVAQPGVSHERNVSVSSAAQSAPLSPSGAAGAPLANNAMASMNEAVSSVPASSPLPASSSPLLQQQPKLRTAYAGMDSAAEASRFPRSSPSPAGPKKERGNLHCIICFRNDEVEPNLERYEDTALWVAGTAAASPRSSVSSLPRVGSFSSNEADV